MVGQIQTKQDQPLKGGWETWFEEQSYIYTWWQIWAFIAAFALALAVGWVGFSGSKRDANGDSPKLIGLIRGGHYEDEKNHVVEIPSHHTGERKWKEEWTGALYKDCLILESTDATMMIPAGRLIDVEFHKDPDSAARPMKYHVHRHRHSDW